MENERVLYSMFIGLAVFAFVFAGLTTRFQDPQTRKALSIGALGIAGISGLWYYQHPGAIESFVSTVAGQAAAIVLAALAAALIFWKIRSFFTA